MATDGPNNDADDDAPLFARPVFGTSYEAGLQAAKKSGSRKARILELLAERPRTCFEVAAIMGLDDHVISGRFTNLANDDRLIVETGFCKRHPKSGCKCTVWQLKATGGGNAA